MTGLVDFRERKVKLDRLEDPEIQVWMDCQEAKENVVCRVVMAQTALACQVSKEKMDCQVFETAFLIIL